MSSILSTIADEYIQELSVFDEEVDSWVIKDALAADWALDKIREAKAEHSRNEMIVNEKIKQLQGWLAKEKEKSNKTISYFTWKLEEFFDTVPNKKATKTQEVCKLPSGTLKRRFQSRNISATMKNFWHGLRSTNNTNISKSKNRRIGQG